MNTSENCPCVELARLPISKMEDVLLARFIGRDEAAKMGFAPDLLTRLATVISEITRNVVQHAGAEGEFKLGRLTNGDLVGLRVIVADRGRGMEHPEQQAEKRGPGAAGAGLPGSRQLVDRLIIRSAPGQGTTVTMDLWKT